MAITLRVRVQPGTRRGEILGWQGETLRVRVQAPPIEGRANQALVEFLAEHLRLPRSAVSIRMGHTSREKLLTIEGIDDDELKRRLPAPPSHGEV